MNSSFGVRFYQRGHASFLLIGLAFAWLLKMSWFRWGDLVIDLGREMYVPAKLASGSVLYRDIFYLYGPFSPYFNALLYKIFGTHILSLVLGGILVTALTSILLYKIARMFLNVFFATFLVLTFLFVLAFGHYVPIGNYNFILPYSYPATHAILFALGALYFLFRFLDRSLVKDAYMAGVFIFLCAVSRVEIGLMLVVSVLAGAVILKLSGVRALLFRPLVLYPLAGSFLVYGIFFVMAGPHILESNLFDILKSNTQASPFATMLSGANASAQNLALMLKAAVFYLFLALGLAGAGYAAGWASRCKGAFARWSLYTGISVVALAGAVVFLKTVYSFELQYRSLPIMYVIVGLLSLAAYVRSGRKPGELKLFILSLFSLCVVMRIIMNVHAWHYGFYILVPGLIVYYIFFFRILPQLTHHKFMTVAFYLGFTLVLVILMVDHFQISRAYYQHRTQPVPSLRGEMSVVPGPQAEGVRQLVDFLRTKTAKDATVAVFPEGVTLNFLAERDNPLYYYSFLPPDMVRAHVEQSMVDDVAFKRPDYIVILQRDVQEYGSRGFGVDYGKKILAYIEKNYVPAAHTGPLPFAPDNFSAVIFRSKH